MKKTIVLVAALLAFSSINIFADTDDDLFGGSSADDSLFGGDDDLFGDDGIEELTDVKAKSDLSKGVIFDDGTVKIGGIFTSEITTETLLASEKDTKFKDNIKDTKLTPNVGALLSVDARPSQDLRMYSKFGFRYPFHSTAVTGYSEESLSTLMMGGIPEFQTSVTDWIYLKEMFTDFSIADRAFFRFGLHTVTWGAGYFFSPVSDIINTTSINPEDVDAQVDGCLNLRTQITFPGTQNCLWLYVIPSYDYAKNTAAAGKFDLVLGGWELGFGGYVKYNSAPKATLTATGSIGKFNLFGEAVYQYGSNREWTEKSDKTNIFKATAGFMYTWKEPSITLAMQYYYDGNNFKLENTLADATYLKNNPLYIKDNFYQGHNIAGMLSFGRILGTTDLTASVFGMVNFGRKELPATIKGYLSSYDGADALFNKGTFSGMLYYSPVKTLKLGMGPYVTVKDWKQKPDVALKLSVTLGGGSF